MAHSGRLAIVPSRALDDTRMTPALLRTLNCLCTYADRNGWLYGKQGKMAKRLGITRSTINRDIQQLAEMEYLEIVAQHRADGGRMNNRYRILYDNVLPRAFDRWRPEYDDIDGDVIDEDFADPLSQDATPPLSQGATPPVARAARGLSQEPREPRRTTATAETTQVERPKETTPRTPHPVDERRDLAEHLVGGFWDGLAVKPLQARTTVRKLVERALAAGALPHQIEAALPLCKTFTTAGFQLALSTAVAADPVAIPDRELQVIRGERPPCDVCFERGYLELADNTIFVCRHDGTRPKELA